MEKILFNNCVEQNERPSKQEIVARAERIPGTQVMQRRSVPLWRELENSNKRKEAFLLTFIDYSKAFDSLDWEKLWKVLEFAGCPNTNVIRGLYERSTISIRITGDGDLATRFRQKRGIRQGSSILLIRPGDGFQFKSVPNSTLKK